MSRDNFDTTESTSVRSPRVEVDDGVELGTGFASPKLVTQNDYQFGVYDRNEKQFLGFALVVTTLADGNARAVARVHPVRRSLR